MDLTEYGVWEELVSVKDSVASFSPWACLWGGGHHSLEGILDRMESELSAGVHALTHRSLHLIWVSVM